METLLTSKTSKSGNVTWILKVNQEVVCRHCGAKKLKEGYFCPNDKLVSCKKCAKLDNNYKDHSIKYLFKGGDQHTHYNVMIEKKKVKNNG